MSKTIKVFEITKRTTFIHVADDGAAVFFDPTLLYQVRMIGTYPPLDGAGTFRLDETSCAVRYSNQVNEERLKANFSDLYEFDLSQTRAALLAVQAFKKQKGILLDTPEVTHVKQQAGPRRFGLDL